MDCKLSSQKQTTINITHFTKPKNERSDVSQLFFG